MTLTERIFILGGTGNIGRKVVQDLLAKNIAVTLYARTPAKVESLFPKVHVVQGDYNDLAPLKDNIQGHTRLFLLVFGFDKFVETKAEIAKAAYEAGVKQIVDISSFTVNMGWRTSFIGSKHYHGEKAIFDMSHRGGYFVALRPGRFMSNLLDSDHPLLGAKIYDATDGDCRQGWISTHDIGAVAAVVLSQDIHKHGDAVYSLTGDVVTPIQRADILTRVLGQEIMFQQITPAEKYHRMMQVGHCSHLVAMDVCCALASCDDARVTPEIAILLGREPETLEQYLTANKAAYRI